MGKSAATKTKKSKGSKAKQFYPKRSGPKYEYAIVREVGVMPTVCNSNQAYQMYNINLSNTTRAKIVAQGFLEYRVKSVTLRFKPSSDTYTQGSKVS